MLNDNHGFHITEAGAGQVWQAGDAHHLHLPAGASGGYHNAQISTYQHRRDFQHRPPLTLTLRAHATGRLYGTAGFGFWNHPYAPGQIGFRLPKAAWFFYSAPPNDMPLARDVPGSGWKAATFDATRPAFLALLPTAPIGFLLMRSKPLYRRLWPIAQAAIGVSEHLLPAESLYVPHTYGLHWAAERVAFMVDGVVIHESPFSPRGALGCIAWADNQYAIVTPQGRFGFGMVECPEAGTLILEDIHLQTG